jgi:hypothetical protein
MHFFTSSEIASAGMLGTLAGTWLGAQLNGHNQRKISAAMIDSQRVTTSTALAAQVKLVESERLWNERKQIYLDILDDVEQRSEFRSQIDSADGTTEYAPTAEAWRSLNVRTVAFGSSVVQDLLIQGRRRHLQWIEALRRQRSGDFSEGDGSTVEAALAKADAVDKSLIREIRRELQGDEPESQSGLYRL